MLRAGELCRITVQPWQGPWAAEWSQVLKRVIGRLSVALSVKIITWNGKHSDRTAYNELSLSAIFLWLSVKAFYEKGKNLTDLPRLNQEARGYFTVPDAVTVVLNVFIAIPLHS